MDTPRLLAVGGFHVLDEYPARCVLADVRPPGAVHDRGWADVLAFEAWLEGTVEVRCGAERVALEIVTPVRLRILPANNVHPAVIGTGERFAVQAHLYDRMGRELEVGKLTTLQWSLSDLVKPAVDRSAAEFGFCDTCYGRYAFPATAPGCGWISAELGGFTDTLEVTAEWRPGNKPQAPRFQRP